MPERPEFREPPNLPVLFEALYRHEVRYVLFGTVGLIAYGANLTTGDLDICIATDEANLARLAGLLTELEAKPRFVPGWSPQPEEYYQTWQPFPLTLEQLDHDYQTSAGDLDLVPHPFGPNGRADRFDYTRLNQTAVTKQVFGVPVRVAALEDLLASKLSARRPKDLRLLPQIERIQQAHRQGQLLGWPLLTEAPDLTS